MVLAAIEAEPTKINNLIPFPRQRSAISSEQTFGTFPLAKDGQQAFSQFAEVNGVPPELTRRKLQSRRKEGKVSESDAHKRGRAVEIYVRDIIATQTDLVESVELHDKPDERGSDILIRLRKGLATKELLGEIKSSSGEIRSAKKKLRNHYLIAEEGPNGQLTGPWVGKMTRVEWEALEVEKKEAIMSQLLTELGVILINGGEKDNREKTPAEILEDSFIPQLQRKLSSVTPEGNKKIGIFPQTDQLRIWEWIHTGEFASLTEFESDNQFLLSLPPKSASKYQLHAWPEGQITTGGFTDITKSPLEKQNRLRGVLSQTKNIITQLFR